MISDQLTIIILFLNSTLVWRMPIKRYTILTKKTKYPNLELHPDYLDAIFVEENGTTIPMKHKISLSVPNSSVDGTMGAALKKTLPE